MFPIRDDQPSFSTPFVNYFIIALNVVVFLFEQSIEYQDPRAYLALCFSSGLCPSTSPMRSRVQDTSAWQERSFLF